MRLSNETWFGIEIKETLRNLDDDPCSSIWPFYVRQIKEGFRVRVILVRIVLDRFMNSWLSSFFLA